MDKKIFDEYIIEYNKWLDSLTNPKSFLNNILTGVGSVLDLSGNSFECKYPLSSLSPEEQDTIAIASDWKRIGKDLEKIIT
jgi:hypothetical protein